MQKIRSHNDAIRKNIASLLHFDKKYNIKTTGEEGLGFTGAKEGTKEIAIITALRNMNDERLKIIYK